MPSDASAPALPTTPILFLHIPKTAGTSLLLGLQNLFGDNRVLRLAMEDPQLRPKIADIVSGRMTHIACVSGHVPLYEFAGHLDKFLPFTVLRWPVHRTFSQFRFLRHHAPAVLARMGLRPGFSFAEYLAAEAPEIFTQVHNGMTRVLCGMYKVWDINAPEYRNIASYPTALNNAVRALERMDFGVAEDMAATFRLLNQRLAVPFPLDNPTVNVTDQRLSADEESPENIQEIVRLNQLDIALYHAAVGILSARAKQAALPWNGRHEAIFAPALNVVVRVGDIAGRRGFHGVEENVFAWLRADGPASIRFRCPAAASRVMLRCYCADPDYPIERIVIDLNGRRIPQRATRDSDGWFELEAGPFGATSEQNLLGVSPPCFHRAAPGTEDDRLLSIALGAVEFRP